MTAKTNLPGNPIVDELTELFDFMGEAYFAPEGLTDATMIATAIEGLAKAQLVTAYEQRTANLIALNEYELKRKAIATPPAEVRARLGIGETQ